MTFEKTTRRGLASALIAGSAVHVLTLAVVIDETSTWVTALVTIACWIFLAWWPVPSAMRAPGMLRGALVLGPATMIMAIPNRPLGTAAALVLSVSVVVRWRGALELTNVRADEWLGIALASAGGGPMGGLLLSPRIDPMRVFEPIEVHDLSIFQRIAVTRERGVSRLLLDGNRQLSSDDEREYHEALVRPVMSHRPRTALILGGGDGLAAREVLAHAFVERCTLVELDRRVTDVIRGSSLASLTGSTFDDARLQLVFEDALTWLDEGTSTYEAIIVDFPDPTTVTLAALFAKQTWVSIGRRLAPDGRVVLQAGAPRHSFVLGSIVRSIEACGLASNPYARAIESLGANGFVLAARTVPKAADARLHVPAQTLATDRALQTLLRPLQLEGGEVISRDERASLWRLSTASRQGVS